MMMLAFAGTPELAAAVPDTLAGSRARAPSPGR